MNKYFEIVSLGGKETEEGDVGAGFEDGEQPWAEENRQPVNLEKRRILSELQLCWLPETPDLQTCNSNLFYSLHSLVCGSLL